MRSFAQVAVPLHGEGMSRVSLPPLNGDAVAFIAQNPARRPAAPAPKAPDRASRRLRLNLMGPCRPDCAKRC